MDLDFETYNSLKSYIEQSNFIYIIYSDNGCKIGYSKSPLKRIEQIKLGLPSQQCFFIGLYMSDKAFIYEKRLHKIFKTQKISGEWFILNDENLEYIDNYLLRNNFKCLIKKSIIWANYLIPSIYLKGKVKIIQKTHHKNNKITLTIPRAFTDLILKPEPEEIDNNIAEFLTPSQISEKLSIIGIKCDPITIGKFLTNMKFTRTTKRIPEIGPRKGYYVKIKD